MRILSFLLCLFLLIPALPSAAEEDLCGVWYARFLIDDVNTYLCSENRLRWTLILREDGTFWNSIGAESQTGTWEYTGADRTVHLTGPKIKNYDMLILDPEMNWLIRKFFDFRFHLNGEIYIVYRRGVPPVFSLNEIRAASADTFEGTWTAGYLESGGTLYVIDELALLGEWKMYSSMVIGGDSLLFLFGTGENDVRAYRASVTFTDGSLAVSELDGCPLRIDEILMTDQDLLKVSLIGQDGSVTCLYYHRAEQL